MNRVQLPDYLGLLSLHYMREVADVRRCLTEKAVTARTTADRDAFAARASELAGIERAIARALGNASTTGTR